MPKQSRVRVGVPLSPQVMNKIGELDTFPQSTRSYDPAGDWSLVFRIWGCHGYQTHPNSGNKNMGVLNISKTDITDGSFALIVMQDTVNDRGIVNRVEARITCKNNEIAAPQDWTLSSRFIDAEGNVMPELATRESGRIDESRVFIKVQNREFVRKVATPLTTEWALFEALQRLPFDSNASIDFFLLENLSLFKPRQQLVYRGKLPQIINGQEMMLHRFDHTGPGNLPWEYWLDDNHRLLAVISMNKAYWLDDDAKTQVQSALAAQQQRYFERRKKQ